MEHLVIRVDKGPVRLNILVGDKLSEVYRKLISLPSVSVGILT